MLEWWGGSCWIWSNVPGVFATSAHGQHVFLNSASCLRPDYIGTTTSADSWSQFFPITSRTASAHIQHILRYHQPSSINQ